MNAADKYDEDYWYFHKEELREGQVFRSHQGVVKLDRTVPGDGTKWYVADWFNDSWSYEDNTIEPGELQGAPIRDPAA